jgi:hypothetical protein
MKTDEVLVFGKLQHIRPWVAGERGIYEIGNKFPQGLLYCPSPDIVLGNVERHAFLFLTMHSWHSFTIIFIKIKDSYFLFKIQN